MKIRWTSLALALGVVSLTASAVSAAPRHHKKKPAHKTVKRTVKTAASGAENSLVGVTLFDNGLHLIDVYGSPDSVQPANVATFTQTGGNPGGGGTPFGGPKGGGGGAPFAPRGPGGGKGAGASTEEMTPSDFGDEMLRQAGAPMTPPGVPGGPPGGPGGPNGPGGRGGFGGPGGIPGVPGAPGGGGAPSGGAQADNVVYTRWSYVRGGSRYGFVLDKYNRVVQIEAIGITNPKVHTKRGIGFGASFGQILRAYGTPDGYDISGDTSITLRYLTRSKVAFKLTRLGPKKPVQLTGIVIAAAKG